MKVRKRVLPRTMAEHINIRLKLVRGNLVIIVGLGLKVDWNQSGLCALHRRSRTQNVCRSIIILDHRSLGWSMISYGSLSFFISKMHQNHQFPPKPENIIKRLQNNYNVFKHLYTMAKSG